MNDDILNSWSTIDPPSDFAERVLAACDPPARRSWVPIAIALAVAGVLAPLLFSPRIPSSTPAIARSADLDLGQQTD